MLGMLVGGFFSPVAAGPTLPNLLATNTGTSLTNSTSVNITVNYGAESGSNRILVLWLLTNEGSSTTLNSATYNGVAGTAMRESRTSSNSTGERMQIRGWFWKESQISGWSSGNKTLTVTASVARDTWSAHMQLWENIEQDMMQDLQTYVGDGNESSFLGTTGGTAPLTGNIASGTLVGNAKDYGVSIILGVAETSGTYVTGDLDVSTGNVTWGAEVNPANSPGHASRSGWDVYPDADETYSHTISYGAAAPDSYCRGYCLLPALKNSTAALDTTVTSGTNPSIKTTTSSVNSKPVTNYIAGHGFDAGADMLYSTTFGSIANGTYTDAGSNSRTLTACYWTETGTLYLQMSGGSIPDTDETFYAIEIDGIFFMRQRAFYSGAEVAGTVSAWTWGTSVNPFAGANPDTFKIWCRDAVA